MRVTVRFAWYDMWVGAYLDTSERQVYICPLPCLVVRVRLSNRGSTRSAGESS